jgi:DNA-binding SARP family transcriptional activator
LEDLEGRERLSPLLRHLGGLVLLASRQALTSSEIPLLMTKGKLLHLKAHDLAFTLDEAERLVNDPQGALAIWERSQGWPLPLHLAALTGEVPERQALLEGVRESLSEGEWEELLLLATLSHLPQGAASAATRRLAEAGFAQPVEAGYKLHPLAAETVIASYEGEVRRVLERQAPRLPALLRGEAYERAGFFEGLAALLEDIDETLISRDPAAVLRWDALAPPPRGPMRRQQVGYALCLTGRREEGLRELLEAAAMPEASVNERLVCYMQAVWHLAEHDPDRARQVAALGEGLLAEADPEYAGRFLSNVHRLSFRAGNWEEAEAILRRALAYFPATSTRRPIVVGNLAIVQWHRSGDVEALLAGRAEALALNVEHYPSNVPGDHLQLGEVKLFLGRRFEALKHFRLAWRWARANPGWALQAEALRANLEGDLEAFPKLLARAGAWPDAAMPDRVRALWAKTLREGGRAEQALRLLGKHDGFRTALERALVLHALGQEALATLPAEPGEASEREARLYWQAARYRITRRADDLAALLDLTLVRERILPGLVPLDELPRERPELSRFYPVVEVLRSGWKEAIALKIDEAPQLELDLLGTFSVRRLGERVSLSARQRDLLVLLALGRGREAIGEALWPGTDPDKARNNLYVQLNLLRKALEPWGVPTYVAEGGLIRTRADLWELEEALERGDPERVWQLYRGPLAPGADIAAVDEARENLHKQVVELLTRGAQAEGGQRAQGYLERVLELEPLHEEAMQHLLCLLVTRGRHREAERRYRRFAERLKGELDLEPLPRTRRIIEGR